MNWQEAVRLCKSILSDVEDLPEAAEDFGAGVSEKVSSIQEWIENHQTVTDKMVEALENIQTGVERWQR